ncbi:hypothetical protein J5U23_01442 [Saccharolobus shibatae B12]|uniref:Glycosyl transferase family 1 domain-containing protein n=1 Tax=Saccharolobus shibatae (strain ATCC 51178 / DSM 5389 / JCM 8931 / NBRC 15437 / B12) TaxID=523848 RepID=A0A8F5GT48_SACSH|nr:glycosyltransferase [Saccharolobus shibatae]QXJ28573.1 hypothetical protein J5U23_01442 [Saccharolobus shibatae B12]
MRVLIIGDVYPEYYQGKDISGGSTRSTVFVSKVSSYFDKAYYIPSILGSSFHIENDDKYIDKLYNFASQHNLEIPINISLYKSLNIKSILHLDAINRIAKELERHEFDLIYVTSEIPTDLDLATKIKAKIRGFLIHGSWLEGSYFDEIKYVLSTHNCLNPLYVRKKLLERLFISNYLRRILSRKKFKFAIYINPNSLKRYNIVKYDIYTKRLYPGIAIKLPKDNKNAARDGIVSISTAFTPFKGVCRLVRFLKLLKKENININIKLIGEMTKEFRSKINNIVKNNDLIKIQIFGKINNDEVINYIRTSKIGINFSYRETYSFTTLELIANKVPVIMFRHNDLEEIYRDVKPIIFINNEKELLDTIKKLKEGDLEYLFDDKTKKFLEDHSNWDKVVSNEIDIIKTFL